jgi:hypothetical protein
MAHVLAKRGSRSHQPTHRTSLIQRQRYSQSPMEIYKSLHDSMDALKDPKVSAEKLVKVKHLTHQLQSQLLTI